MPFVLRTPRTDAPAGQVPAFTAVPGCPRDDGGEIVVCGSLDQERYRLRPPPTRFDQGKRPIAETPSGGGTLGATAEQGSVGGVPTIRVRLSWKLKF